jgi:hypothetical protein
MHVNVRSHLTAGVALAGAGIIAVTPVTPVLRDIQVPAVSTAEVQLASLLNPLEVFAPILEQAMANAQAIGQKMVADPLPILRALALNQLDGLGTLAGLGTDVAQVLAGIALAMPGHLQTAIGLLQTGNVDQALRTIENGVIGPWFPLVYQDLPQLINVLKQPLVDAQTLLENAPMSYLAGIGFPVLNSFFGVQTQIINGITGVVAALSTGNPEKIVNAIITGAANFTQELLNGNPATGTYGLLGIYGPINGFLDTGSTLAYFLRPPVDPFALKVAPRAAATSVTLVVPPAVKAAIPAGMTPAREVAAQVAATPATEGVQSTGTSTGPEAGPTGATKGTEDSATSDDGVTVAVSATLATNPTGGDKVVPGQTRHDSSPAGSGSANSSKGVRDGITKTVKNMTDGLKKAAKNVTGRSDKSSASTRSNTSDSSSTSRGTGGAHHASE